MKKRQFTVYGTVQGVGFRYFTWRIANKIGVIGSVRNLSDGSVLVIAGGSEQQVMELHDWLQNGPPTASVEYVIAQDYIGNIEVTEFSIEH